MMAAQRLLLAAIVALAFVARASAGGATPIQDFCVADLSSDASANLFGLPRKNPKSVTAEDFFFPGLRAGSTANTLGFNMTLLDVHAVPGLNTLGVSTARLGFGPRGVNPPHYHPRTTEILNILEGSLLVGFVTSSPENKLFLKTLHAGDVFVFPAGLVHFQYSGGKTALAISAFSSQNPGTVVVRDAVFGAKPAMPVDAVEPSFGVDKDIINLLLRAQFK